MRKSALILLLLLALTLAVAACGGGGSSSSGTTSGSGTSAEAAWAKEVTAVMFKFENSASAQLSEQINTSISQPVLESLYTAYSFDLSLLAKKLEATEAPAACVAVRKEVVGYTRQVAAIAKELAHQPHLTAEKYAQFGGEQGAKIDKISRRLGTLTAKPSC